VLPNLLLNVEEYVTPYVTTSTKICYNRCYYRYENVSLAYSVTRIIPVTIVHTYEMIFRQNPHRGHRLGNVRNQEKPIHKMIRCGPKNDFQKNLEASESGRLVQIQAVSSEIGRRPHGAACLPRKLARVAGM
jgi:hypothetical protein